MSDLKFNDLPKILKWIKEPSHSEHLFIIEQALNQSEVGQNQFYIQSLAGLNSFITIPGLNSLLDSNIIINKAEIKLPCENYELDNFPPSNNLFLTRKNENQEDEFLPDFFQGNFEATSIVIPCSLS